MSDNLLKSIHFLQLVGASNTPRAQKIALIKTLSKSQLNAISELSMNLLNGNITITTEEASKLRKFRAPLRLLASRRHNIAHRLEAVTLPLVVAVLQPALLFVTQQLEKC